MTLLLDHASAGNDIAMRQPLMPDPGRGIPAAVQGKPTRLYLVGEAERSTRPAATSGRTTISINGCWHALRGKTATFEQLLRIAFPARELNSPGSATVMFRHGVPTWPAGSLTPGDVIELTEGLLVNANATYAS